MNYRIWFSLLVCLLLASACQPQKPVETAPSPPKPDDFSLTPGTPGPVEPINSYSPGKGDESMQRGAVYIDSTDILTLESFPLQFQLNVKGSLPTPCHQLRVVIDQPNQQNEIRISIYSLVDPNTVCTQVLKPFEVNIPLGSFPSGKYTVFVNDENVGEIMA
ncbi:MAG: hypothetical protein ACM3Y8_05765 [Byssovorax cruenta]